MNIIIKVLLFLISYIPLYLILFIREISKDYISLNRVYRTQENMISHLCEAVQLAVVKGVFCKILLILMVVPIICFAIIVFLKLKKKESTNKSVGNLKTTGDTIVSYLMTYVIPFTSIGLDTDAPSVISSGILFSTVMILFIRLDTVYLNPPFILMGFNIYTETTTGKHYLSRNTLVELKTAHLNDECWKVIRLTNNFFYARKL